MDVSKHMNRLAGIKQGIKRGGLSMAEGTTVF